MESKKIVLLGCGFTGKYLIDRFSGEPVEILCTNRNKPGSIRFDLNDESTWKNIPDNAEIIWLFPAESIEKVKEFSKNRTIRIVLGTTSSYKEKSGVIDENSELDFTLPRVEGEEFLRSKGAVVLRCSGIYRYDRNPFSWLKKGLIKNGNKTVNLIHVDDLAEIIFQLIDSEFKGEVFAVSDGEKYWWKEIVASGKKRNFLDSDFVLPEKEVEEKFVGNGKLKKFLGEEFEFQKLIH